MLEFTHRAGEPRLFIYPLLKCIIIFFDASKGEIARVQQSPTPILLTYFSIPNSLPYLGLTQPS